MATNSAETVDKEKQEREGKPTGEKTRDGTLQESRGTDIETSENNDESRDGTLQESRNKDAKNPEKEDAFRDGSLQESRAVDASKQTDSQKNSTRGV